MKFTYSYQRWLTSSQLKVGKDSKLTKPALSVGPIIKIFTILLLIYFAVFNVVANTITSASCNDTDIQIAINSATNGNDIVKMPTNNAVATWNNGITNNGQGFTLDLGQLTVTRGSGTEPLIYFLNNPTNYLFLINGTLKQDIQYADLLKLDGSFSNAEFAVTNMNFYTTANGSILVEVLQAYGVFGHDSFTAPANSEMIHNVAYGAGNNDSTNGWFDTVTPGTTNAVFIEYCNFTNNDTFGNPAYYFGNSAWQAYYGARTVGRHDIFNMSQIDNHGGSLPGGRWWEYYLNTWVLVANANQSSYLDLRAGSGMVWSNTVSGSNLGAGSIHLGLDGGGDSSLYGYPGKGIMSPANASGTPTVVPAYIWGNDSAMSISADGVLGTDYFASAPASYAPAPDPHPLDGGSTLQAGTEIWTTNITTSGAYQFTVPSNISAGTTLVAAMIVNSGTGVLYSPSDSAGNTWTSDITNADYEGDGQSLQLLHSKLTTGLTTSSTVNFSLSAGTSCQITFFTVLGSSGVDTTARSDGSSTSVSCPFTTSHSSTLPFAYVALHGIGGITYTGQSTWTVAEYDGAGNRAYQVLGPLVSSGTQDVGGTLNILNDYGVACLVFY